MYALRNIQPNSITVSCFDHDLDKPTVKRPVLGNKGKSEQENSGEASLNRTS